jgi:hypothetical protein
MDMTSTTRGSFGLAGDGGSNRVGSKSIREGEIRKVVETDVWVACVEDEEKGNVEERRSNIERRQERERDGNLRQIESAHLPRWI